MNCKWCNKKLTKAQVYEYLRGKTKGTACSASCSMLLKRYKSHEKYIVEKKCKCKNCNKTFVNYKKYNVETCSAKCAYELSSKRMKEDNPMKNDFVRQKVSNTLKAMKHKPLVQGGNGRPATKEQLDLYNEITLLDDSFEMELIEKTGKLKKTFNAPNHYKIDIGSRIHKIAIEIDGKSHNSLKIKECDTRKTQLLILKGWKVLRFTNSQIQKELKNCVQMVMSMT